MYMYMYLYTETEEQEEMGVGDAPALSSKQLHKSDYIKIIQHSLVYIECIYI